MRWFNNLNATPRLMLSFGVLIALIGGISYLAIANLGTSNDRLDLLYHKDMIGAGKADGITISIASISRDNYDMYVHAAETAIVADDEKQVLALLADLHADLDAADKLFVNKTGLEQLAILRKMLPDYERLQNEFLHDIESKDLTAAKAALDAIMQDRKLMRGASDIARTSKEEHAEEQFLANDRAFQSARSLLLFAAVASVALGVLLSIVIARGFSVPLGHAVATLQQLAAGDLTVSLEVHTKDEVGRMAEALNEAVERLRTTLREVAAGAASTSSSSQQLAAAAETIASGAQEQAASLEETSASLEQITATVRQSADNAKQASQLAAGSRESAEQGQDVVSTAISAMAEINTASEKISDIISTINEIAFQTNLLAVNAAIEAARAGEEGRGFAVVATEVRSLAQRSAEAAKEIKGLIQDSVEKVEKGSELVNRSGATLQGIVGSVKRVTDIVGEIASASAEQSAGVEQVNTAVTQMDQVTQANAAQTEELSSTAQSLSDQSTRLMELVGSFQLGDAVEATWANRGPQQRRAVSSSSRVGGRHSAGAAVSVSAAKSIHSTFSEARRPSASTALVNASAADNESFEEF